MMFQSPENVKVLLKKLITFKIVLKLVFFRLYFLRFVSLQDL